MIIGNGLPSEHELTIYLDDMFTSLEEVVPEADGGIAFFDHKLSTTPQLGTWTRVSFTLDLVGKTCSATLDSAPLLTPCTLDPSWTTGTITISLGLSYVEAETQTWQTRYDNVVFDFQ